MNSFLGLKNIKAQIHALGCLVKQQATCGFVMVFKKVSDFTGKLVTPRETDIHSRPAADIRRSDIFRKYI